MWLFNFQPLLLIFHSAQAKLRDSKSGKRSAARSARRRVFLAQFLPAHTGLPKLFSRAEVDAINAGRPSAAPRLELLETGLLRHCCCFPSCPEYLVDQRSSRELVSDRGGGGARNAVNQHLAPLRWPEVEGSDVYVPGLHLACLEDGRRRQRQQHRSHHYEEPAVVAHLSERVNERSPAAKELKSPWLQDAAASLSDTYMQSWS